jgi:hypothetical protein
MHINITVFCVQPGTKPGIEKKIMGGHVELNWRVGWLPFFLSPILFTRGSFLKNFLRGGFYPLW